MVEAICALATSRPRASSAPSRRAAASTASTRHHSRPSSTWAEALVRILRATPKRSEQRRARPRTPLLDLVREAEQQALRPGAADELNTERPSGLVHACGD